MWVRLDDCLPDNVKVEGLSHAAFRLYITGLCYSGKNETDGKLSRGAVAKCAATLGRANRLTAELCEAGLWSENGSGWVIKDFLEYNPSSDELKAQRGERAARTKALRDLASDIDGDKSHDVGGDSRPTRPVPVYEKSYDDFVTELGLTPRQRAEAEALPQKVLLDAMAATLSRSPDRPAAYFMVLVRKRKAPAIVPKPFVCLECRMTFASDERRREHLFNVHHREDD